MQDTRQYANEIRYTPETTWGKVLEFYDGIKPSQLFLLAFLLVVLLAYYRENVWIGILLFTIIGGLYLIRNESEHQEVETMRKVIYPKSRHIEQDPELVALLYSIQDFYDYNAGAFYHSVVDLDEFMRTYDIISEDPRIAGSSYQLMFNLKSKILQKLQAVLYRCPDDVDVIEKINTAIAKMEEILDHYLANVVELNNQEILSIGVNNHTVYLGPINAPIPYNQEAMI